MRRVPVRIHPARRTVRQPPAVTVFPSVHGVGDTAELPTAVTSRLRAPPERTSAAGRLLGHRHLDAGSGADCTRRPCPTTRAALAIGGRPNYPSAGTWGS